MWNVRFPVSRMSIDQVWNYLRRPTLRPPNVRIHQDMGLASDSRQGVYLQRTGLACLTSGSKLQHVAERGGTRDMCGETE